MNLDDVGELGLGRSFAYSKAFDSSASAPELPSFSLHNRS